jgi:predicted GH43/DUF377 family glycosyl hydrolase
MKSIITTFCLLVLSIVIISTITYGQLPSDPFVAYTGNPVIPRTAGQWDSRAVWWPAVTFVNDTFYIVYNGTTNIPNAPVKIGLATSTNGYNFVKSSLNPILAADGSGFDAHSVDGGLLSYNNSTWYLYYAGRSLPPYQAGNIIGRASSTVSPHGPWIRSDDTLLAVGSPGEWDSEFINPQSIIQNGSEFIIYYWAGITWPTTFPQIGRATSTDGGLTWEKYNDPNTNTPPYLESDPILKPDKPYDNSGIIGCTIFKLDTMWEMYYTGVSGGTHKICYAKSTDGIIWEKDSLNNPIFTVSQDPVALNWLERPVVVKTDSLFFMYYDYGIDIASLGIGLTTAIVPCININPIEIIFGDIEIGSSDTLTFTITNTGYADLELSNITSNEPAFTVNITSDTISPGSDLEIEVTFTPTNTISYSGVIEITHNAVGSPDSVNVIGDGVTGISDELLNTIPDDFVVFQNYPNPFNPKTSIIFGLPKASEVKLTLFNSLGEEVANLFKGYKTAGYYQVEFDATKLSSGVYFYQLKAADPSTSSGQGFVETKKMVLMK